MVWYLPWSESIKKRACRYLLQRYLGNFLNEKLTLEQLSVDLYNGTGTVSDVRLDCEALNELGDSQNWPLEIIDGQVKEITVTIPWSTILKEDSIVEINGLSLTVQPKVRAETVSSMLESMWSSMSSSMQLATEFLQEDAGPQESNPVEGIEMFAHAIDSILSRVKVKFINTKIRLEHVSKNSDKGIALQILIRQIDYFDETETETLPETTKDEKTKTYTNATYLTKKIKVNGVSFYIDEFPSKLRTMAHSLIMEKSTSTPLEKNEETCQESADLNFQSTMSDVFYEARSVISTVDSEIMQDIAEEKQSNTPRESTPHETLAQTDPVLFAKLTDHQELSLRLKHLEEVEGPKIAVQISLGSLLLFITPKQLNTLLELVDAINQPHLEDTSNIPIRSCLNMQCKQMKQKDFQFIEAQLIGNLDRQHLKPQNAFGWSGPSFDDSDDESDKFLPMTSNDEMPKSLTSSISSMNTSMTSSVNIPSLHPKITRNKKVPNVDGDPTAEVSHISFKMASFSCVLLHKNVIVPMPIGTPYITSASTLKLQEMSTEYFNRLETFGNVDKNSNIKTVNEALDKATERDHLRILLTEISLDGSEKVTSHGSKTMFEAYTKRMLVSECLYFQREDPQDQTPQKFDLIWFEHKEKESSVAAAKADMTISFKQTSKCMRKSGEKQLAYPTTDVLINCSPCYIDVDLTLMERMSAVFFAPSTTATPTTPTMPTSPPQKNQMNISVQSPNLNVILRFPVVDLRPGASREVRRVRPDWLAFRFHNATLSTQRRPPASYSVKATSLDLYYHENEKLPPTHIAQTCMDVTALEQNILSGNTTPLLPIITLTLKPREPNENLFESLQDETEFEPSADNPMTTSVYMMENLRSGRPSPFSGKKVAHQSIIKNEKDKKDQEDELIVPGNEEEMTEFTNDSVEHSAVHLDFNLPILSLQIESKHLYEIIYNRINSDLLLWEPQPVDQFDITPHMNVPIHPAFGVCKGMEYDSDTESTASDEEKFYIPTHDDKLRKGHRKYSDKDSEVHNFCLTLKVGKGLMTIFAPVRDSNKLVVPGQMGELVLDVNKLSLCQLSGLNGRPKTARMCLRAGKTTLYNEPILTIPSEKPKLRLYGTPLPSYLKKTIYPSGKGVTIKEQLEVKDMFTMALRTDPKNDLPNIKCICIALSIEQATLRHRGDKGAAWLAQLVDVLDVLDYPVPGYTPSAVLSELHAHVWDCAVDYRPLYLPIRTVLTLGNFSYSSNIIPETNATVLRFLAQECTLFLSHFTGAKSNVRVPQDDDKLPNVHKDYVCVVDVGLFELSLRTEDKKNAPNNHPQVELTASNNMVNLYTCCDSASALCRLVTYIASDGDSQPPAERSRHTSICSDHTGEPLVGLDNRPVEEVSPSDLKHVNDLMEEAMKESPNSTMEEDDLNSSTEKEDVKEFLFPDEANVKQDNLNTETGAQSFEYDDYPPKEGEAKPTNIQVARDLGNTSSTPKSTPQKSKRKKKKSSGEGHNTDDEYCIVEEQVYREDDEMDEPVVTWLGEPRFMIDDHFITTGAKTDVLQAPKSFPLPVLRYTLCELSLTWNIFGGNDFRPIGDTMPTRKTVGIDDTRKQGSPKISKRSKEYEPYETSRAVAAAYRQGGVSYSAGADRVRPPPPASAPAPARRDLRSRGGALRDHGTCVKLCLGKVSRSPVSYSAGADRVRPPPPASAPAPARRDLRSRGGALRDHGTCVKLCLGKVSRSPVSYSAGADRVRPPPPASAPAPARRDLRSRGGALRDHGTCVKLCLGKVSRSPVSYSAGADRVRPPPPASAPAPARRDLRSRGGALRDHGTCVKLCLGKVSRSPVSYSAGADRVRPPPPASAPAPARRDLRSRGGALRDHGTCVKLCLGKVSRSPVSYSAGADRVRPPPPASAPAPARRDLRSRGGALRDHGTCVKLCLGKVSRSPVSYSAGADRVRPPPPASAPAPARRDLRSRGGALRDHGTCVKLCLGKVSRSPVSYSAGADRVRPPPPASAPAPARRDLRSRGGALRDHGTCVKLCLGKVSRSPVSYSAGADRVRPPPPASAPAPARRDLRSRGGALRDHGTCVKLCLGKVSRSPVSYSAGADRVRPPPPASAPAPARRDLRSRGGALRDHGTCVKLCLGKVSRSPVSYSAGADRVRPPPPASAPAPARRDLRSRGGALRDHGTCVKLCLGKVSRSPVSYSAGADRVRPPPPASAPAPARRDLRSRGGALRDHGTCVKLCLGKVSRSPVSYSAGADRVRPPPPASAPAPARRDLRSRGGALRDHGTCVKLCLGKVSRSPVSYSAGADRVRPPPPASAPAPARRDLRSRGGALRDHGTCVKLCLGKVSRSPVSYSAGADRVRPPPPASAPAPARRDLRSRGGALRDHGTCVKLCLGKVSRSPVSYSAGADRVRPPPPASAPAPARRDLRSRGGALRDHGTCVKLCLGKVSRSPVSYSAGADRVRPPPPASAPAPARRDLRSRGGALRDHGTCVKLCLGKVSRSPVSYSAGADRVRPPPPASAPAPARRDLRSRGGALRDHGTCVKLCLGKVSRSPVSYSAGADRVRPPPPASAPAPARRDLRSRGGALRDHGTCVKLCLGKVSRSPVSYSAGADRVRPPPPASAPAPARRDLRSRGGALRDHGTCVKLCLGKVSRSPVSYSAGADRVRPPPPASAPAPARRDLRSRGGALRDHGTCVKLCLGKVKLQHEVYPQGSTYASRQTLAITKIEVLDRLLCSDINKLLSQHYPPNEPQRKNTHMLVIKAVHLRVPSQECCLKVSLMPLWFNLDQDTIGFLANFFTKLGSDETNNEDTSLGGLSTESTGSRQTTPTHRPPVMSLGSAPRAPPSTPTSLGDADSLSLNESGNNPRIVQGSRLIITSKVIRDDEPLMENYEAERLVSENLIQLEEDFQRLGINPEKPTTKVPESEPVDDSPIYFRRVVFTPEVPIRLDYVRKCFDMSVGPLAGLIMGLGHLNYSELTLKRLDHRSGLLGFQKLVQWALNEWLMDIKKNQLPGLLSGIGPMHSLLQIVTGICDLVWLPVEQWRRDGRLVHGLRRGAASFTARTAVAALDITARLLHLIQRDGRLVHGLRRGAASFTARTAVAALDITARLLHLIQATAETACDMLTPSASLALRERRPRRRRDSRPPADIREGVNSAYNTVREGIAETAATMVVAARSGSGAGVLRHLPGAAVTPLALAAAGAADVLGGVRAHLAPHLRRDHADKWRVPDAGTTPHHVSRRPAPGL
ncbi:unnamed protein product [Euphydryas editha]|uniref:Autophagy-related protein 2 n=1 Tax=Euphydryas editha TaxID=104508 RepID=A0AAU9U774_EUPED|nr:unnamed protein product [Euphydryas editha]